MQILNKSTIDFITRYTLAKAFGIKHGLCANQFAPPMLGNFAFSIFSSFWRCDFSRTQINKIIVTK